MSPRKGVVPAWRSRLGAVLRVLLWTTVVIILVSLVVEIGGYGR